MQVTCGIDTILISRVQGVCERKGQAFLSRVYTVTERMDCESKGQLIYESLAARFAAKEAVAKALGTGIGRNQIRFQHIEIQRNSLGKPQVILHGGALRQFACQGGQTIDISLSHDGNQAVAMCVILWAQRLQEDIKV